MSAPFFQIKCGEKYRIRESNRGKSYNKGSRLTGARRKKFDCANNDWGDFYSDPETEDGYFFSAV
jgi:hypothetical protein